MQYVPESIQSFFANPRRHLIDPSLDTGSTSLPQFKLNYFTLNTVQFNSQLCKNEARTTAFYFQRSLQYFRIAANNAAKDKIKNEHGVVIQDETLAVTIQKNKSGTLIVFDHAQHIDLIKDHNDLYEEKSNALVNYDLKIMAAYITASVVLCVPFFHLLTLSIAAAAMAYVYYSLSQRATVFAEYKDAQTLLVGTCNWALGPSNHAPLNQLLANQEINRMMKLLYPVLSETQVKHLIADDIEAVYIDARKSSQSRFKVPLISGFFTQYQSKFGDLITKELESAALKQRGSELVRCLYGLNRGEDPMELVRIITNSIPDVLNSIRNIADGLLASDAPAAHRNGL